MRELKSSALAQVTCLLEKLKVKDLPVPRATDRGLSSDFCNEQFLGSITDEHNFLFCFVGFFLFVIFSYNDINYN